MDYKDIARKRFAACLARIDRSYEHLKALSREVNEATDKLVEGDAYRIIRDPNTDPGEYVFRFADVKALPLLRWSLIVGDIVHHARAAFDNLIDALNIRHHGASIRRTEFPVYHRPADFTSGSRPGFKKVGRIPTKAAALVESLQPYHRGNAYKSDPIWLLHELWIMDKHRNPPVAAVVGQQSSIQVIPSFNGVAVDLGAREMLADLVVRFEDGAEIVRIRLQQIAPYPEVKVHPTFTVRVTFGEGSPGEWSEIVPALAECLAYSTEALRKFEQCF